MLYALPFWLSRNALVVAAEGLYRAVVQYSRKWKRARAERKKGGRHREEEK